MALASRGIIIFLVLSSGLVQGCSVRLATPVQLPAPVNPATVKSIVPCTPYADRPCNEPQPVEKEPIIKGEYVQDFVNPGTGKAQYCRFQFDGISRVRASRLSSKGECSDTFLEGDYIQGHHDLTICVESDNVFDLEFQDENLIRDEYDNRFERRTGSESEKFKGRSHTGPKKKGLEKSLQNKIKDASDQNQKQLDEVTQH